VAALAARLDRLHAALAAPDQRGERTGMAAAPITQVSGVGAGRRATPGLVTASEARPWR